MGTDYSEEYKVLTGLLRSKDLRDIHLACTMLEDIGLKRIKKDDALALSSTLLGDTMDTLNNVYANFPSHLTLIWIDKEKEQLFNESYSVASSILLRLINKFHLNIFSVRRRYNVLSKFRGK